MVIRIMISLNLHFKAIYCPLVISLLKGIAFNKHKREKLAVIACFHPKARDDALIIIVAICIFNHKASLFT